MILDQQKIDALRQENADMHALWQSIKYLNDASEAALVFIEEYEIPINENLENKVFEYAFFWMMQGSEGESLKAFAKTVITQFDSIEWNKVKEQYEEII